MSHQGLIKYDIECLCKYHLKIKVDENPARRALVAMTKSANTEHRVLQTLRDTFIAPTALSPAGEGDNLILAQGSPDTDEMDKSASAERERPKALHAHHHHSIHVMKS